MAELDEKYLRESFDKKICPTCGGSIPEKGGYGSGALKDGRFCSLDCYAKYHREAIAKRHKERLAQARRKQN